MKKSELDPRKCFHIMRAMKDADPFWKLAKEDGTIGYTRQAAFREEWEFHSGKEPPEKTLKSWLRRNSPLWNKKMIAILAELIKPDNSF